MVYQLEKEFYGFPSPEEAEPDGFLAIGGRLSIPYLLNAYAMGIFPWFIHEGEPCWFSPDPRMVLFIDEFNYRKSLRRVVKSGKFEVRVDTDFTGVMRKCGETQRDDQDGTWITQEFIDGYTHLHNMGLAHSFETYYKDELVGGLYGVSLGKCFFGESMFHTMTDASKVAFVSLVDFCKAHDFVFIDAQQETEHLASLGARPIPRKDYLDILHAQDWSATLNQPWSLPSQKPKPGNEETDK